MAARRTTPKTSKAPEFVPIRIDTPGDTADVPMVDLFFLDGVAYQIPKKPRMNLVLQFVTDSKKHGEGLANLMLLNKLLGETAFQALASHAALTPDQLGDVAQAAANFTLGSVEAAEVAGN